MPNHSESVPDLEQFANGWADLIGQFTEETGRPPSEPELAEVLTWTFRSVTDQVDGFPPSAVVRSAGTPPRDGRGAESGPGKRGQQMSAEVGELNDAVFVTAADMVSDAVGVLAGAGGRPAAQAVLGVLYSGLERARATGLVRLPDDAAGPWIIRSPGRKTRVHARIGDILAVPVGPGQYRYLIVVAKNRFGTAVGILDESGPLRPTAALRSTALRPVYVGDDSIADGSWIIVGHDEKLLEHFDRDPEIFHDNDPRLPNVGVGPFGSGETASGRMRDLSETEANEIGLVDGSYNQFMMPQELEDLLRTHLRDFF